MKAQFIVTISGNWVENGKTATSAFAEKRLREAAKEGFEFLADRVTVKRYRQATTKLAQDDGEKQ